MFIKQLGKSRKLLQGPLVPQAMVACSLTGSWITWPLYFVPRYAASIYQPLRVSLVAHGDSRWHWCCNPIKEVQSGFLMKSKVSIENTVLRTSTETVPSAIAVRSEVLSCLFQQYFAIVMPKSLSVCILVPILKDHKDPFIFDNYYAIALTQLK